MFSLQRVVGEDGKILELLQLCAEEACHSVAALRTLTSQPISGASLATFRSARKKEKELLGSVADALLHSLVLAIEREDVQALGDSLCRVPKTVDNFARRYIIAAGQLKGVDFSRQIDLMERGCNTVARMIRGLRERAPIADLKQLNANMQKIENDADDLVLEILGGLFEPSVPTLKAIIIKDLVELNEKVVDRCRDAGNVIVRVALKHT